MWGQNIVFEKLIMADTQLTLFLFGARTVTYLLNFTKIY